MDHKVRVINISGYMQRDLCRSCPETWQQLEDAFAYAAKNDVVIVIGAGNDAVRTERYPGDPNSMIVAGATTLNDTRWEEFPIKGSKIKQGTNFGKRLTVMAPTENIQVCIPHEKRFYIAEDGPMGPAPTELEFEAMYEVVPSGATSSAAPIVTSLVALMYSVRPDLDTDTVISIIKEGCDDIGDKGYDIYTGYGRVNFGKTIKIALTWSK